jgi:hypothetical protein
MNTYQKASFTNFQDFDIDRRKIHEKTGWVIMNSSIAI